MSNKVVYDEYIIYSFDNILTLSVFKIPNLLNPLHTMQTEQVILTSVFSFLCVSTMLSSYSFIGSEINEGETYDHVTTGHQ